MESLKIARKSACPRCDSQRALATKDDFYGSYLACLVCGWNGEADENGYPIMVFIPPPPIRRRRRRRRKSPGGPLEDLSPEPVVDSESEGAESPSLV